MRRNLVAEWLEDTLIPAIKKEFQLPSTDKRLDRLRKLVAHDSIYLSTGSVSGSKPNKAITDFPKKLKVSVDSEYRIPLIPVLALNGHPIQYRDGTILEGAVFTHSGNMEKPYKLVYKDHTIFYTESGRASKYRESYWDLYMVNTPTLRDLIALGTKNID